MSQRLRAAALAALSGLAMTACGNPRPADATPTGWLRECPGEAFCFSRPATLVLQPGQAIDSLTARYRGEGVTLVFDMGRYGTSVAHLVKPSQEAALIDGRPAQVLASEQEIVLIVPKVHERGGSTVKFSMTLRFEGKPDGKASRETALRIFQSIEFKPPR